MIRAAVMPAPGKPVEIREVPEPELAPGAALIRTVRADVCGTDVHLRDGRLAGVPYPIVPGHVAAGVLEKVRGDVTDVDGRPFREGDAVTFYDVDRTCHACHACLVAKAETRCPHRKVYGITYGLGDGLLGGWAEKIWIRPGVRLIRLPDGVDPELAVAAGCGLPTAFHAVERAEVRTGDTVLVQGTGPVGIQAIALAKSAGAARVLAIGAPPLRLEIAKAFGADVTFDLAETDLDSRREAILELTGGHGVDRVIEAAGHPSTVPEALTLVRDGGTVVIAGHYTDAGEVAINPHVHLNRKHVDLRGCWGSEFRHFHRSFEWLGRVAGELPFASMVSKVYALGDANAALDDIAGLRVVKALIDPVG